MNKPILCLSLFLISMPSYAYLGPGLGGGAIAAVIGFFAAIFLALWGILYYPIKRALRKQRSNKSKNVENKNSRQDLESD